MSVSQPSSSSSAHLPCPRDRKQEQNPFRSPCSAKQQQPPGDQAEGFSISRSAQPGARPRRCSKALAVTQPHRTAQGNPLFTEQPSVQLPALPLQLVFKWKTFPRQAKHFPMQKSQLLKNSTSLIVKYIILD